MTNSRIMRIHIIRVKIDSQNTTSFVLTGNFNPNYIFETTGMNHLKIINASRGLVHEYQNVKRKPFDCNANIYFNRVSPKEANSKLRQNKDPY